VVGIRCIRGVAAFVLLTSLALAVRAQPQVGPVDPAFAPVDQAVNGYLARYGQPGASVVVAYDDRIVYAQGYGVADRARSLPMSPWLEHRLAQVSKTFTAALILRLVEKGRLSLDAFAWDFIRFQVAFLPADNRIRQVTVRHLLTSTWGLDRAAGGTDIAGGYYVDSGGFTRTSAREQIEKWLLDGRLNFDPGARHADNDIGYLWLQWIAELVDGRSIDAQLAELLGPEALSSGRVRVGNVLPAQITEGEATYHDVPGAAQVTPIPKLYAAPEPARVARPYGSYTLEGYGGAAGLVASALTVTRFVQRLQGIRLPALLQPATWAQMQAEQTPADGTRNVGLGVETLPALAGSADRAVRYQGSLPGTRAGWVSTPRVTGGKRLTVVALVNGSRVWRGDPGAATDDLQAELLTPILSALDGIGATVYAAKPEIAGDRLIAWDTPTEAYFADLLLDWGQITFPDLLKGAPPSLTWNGYRYRYYEPTQTYVGIKQGRVYLYQPASSPDIQPLPAIGDYLPQAMRDLQGRRPLAATASPR
jgi:CubicO group peptidase (beta-lactamase class C family)